MIALLLACSFTRAAPAHYGGCGAGQPKERGTLEDDAIDEASGMVASRRHPGVFWLHNDSGDKARVFAIDGKGRDLGNTDLDDVRAVDWEDMALLPGKEHDWLLLGDIGDNRERRDQVFVHRIPEPEPGAKKTSHQTMTVRYPDGPHNAETLLVDPSDQQIYILTKVGDGPSTLFRLGPWRAGGVMAEPVGRVELPGSMKKTTGGDTRPGLVAIRSYTHVHLYRGPTVPTALASQPCSIGWVEEPQGESITFVPGGLLTVSEGEGATLHEVSIPSE